MIKKRVLSVSPDGVSVKFTDYGIELYRAAVNAQEEWDSQPIIKVETLDHDQLLIRAGETFRANRILREILAKVREEVAVIDPYVGAPLFDLLMPLGGRVLIRVLRSNRVTGADAWAKGAILAYNAFKAQYESTEMRTLVEKVLHDRFILWNRTHEFSLGHSIKDLGTKDTQLTLLTPTADAQWKLFEQRWAEATPIP